MGDGAGEREGKLLRFRSSRIVYDAAIGDCERSAKTRAGQINGRARKRGSQIFPFLRAMPGDSETANRVKAEPQIDCVGVDAACLDKRSNVADHAARSRTQIEIEDDTAVEIDSIEGSRHRGSGAVEPETVGAHRLGEYEHQAACAVFQILARLSVGGGRVGVVDTLQECPRCAARASGDGGCRSRRRIERLDGQPIIGPAFKPFERRAFENGVDELAPIRLARGRKIAGQ